MSCPATGHEWVPPKKGDSRSPCPALNTLANHGYLPHNGKNISIFDLISALRTAYALSLPLAIFLALGGYILLRQWGRISLHDLARHGCIEHDASLAHQNTPSDDEYAPVVVDEALLDELCPRGCYPDADKDGRLSESVSSSGGLSPPPRPTLSRPSLSPPLPTSANTGTSPAHHTYLTPTAVAAHRIRRESVSPPLDGLHAEIARGEMALVLGMHALAGLPGVPAAWLREWMRYQRLPEGWAPSKTLGFLATARMSGRIRGEMGRLRAGVPSVRVQEEEEDAGQEVEVYGRAHVRDASRESDMSGTSSLFSNLTPSPSASTFSFFQDGASSETDVDVGEGEGKEVVEEMKAVKAVQ